MIGILSCEDDDLARMVFLAAPRGSQFFQDASRLNRMGERMAYIDPYEALRRRQSIRQVVISRGVMAVNGISTGDHKAAIRSVLGAICIRNRRS